MKYIKVDKKGIKFDIKCNKKYNIRLLKEECSIFLHRGASFFYNTIVGTAIQGYILSQTELLLRLILIFVI